MNIKPLFDKVVVESVEKEEKTKSGFIPLFGTGKAADGARSRGRAWRYG